MRVLWFEVTQPSKYHSDGNPIGGWQDSLENIVRKSPDIELCIAFISNTSMETKIVDGVVYRPMFIKYSLIDKVFKKHWDVFIEKMIPSAQKVIADVNPDIIHVFGTEWPFGQIAKYTNIPVVIHIQGAVVSLYNANYPPGYSFFDKIRQCWFRPQKLFALAKTSVNDKNWLYWEKNTWHSVVNYMGRTDWDKSLSNIMNSNRKYFHVEEAIRPIFMESKQKWSGYKNKKLKLLSIGCSNFWKGPDMLLKTAKILSDLNIDFEWNVAGNMPSIIRRMVEHKEKVLFSECHINILGFVKPDALYELLISSSLYVHTSHIENSPNSICEAQCCGVPVIATNVGGISTLVRNNVDGILIPANDPWQLANAILELIKDKERLMFFSRNTFEFARLRHNPENILNQLLDCYKSIINN